jgi:hypothetical protein
MTFEQAIALVAALITLVAACAAVVAVVFAKWSAEAARDTVKPMKEIAASAERTATLQAESVKQMESVLAGIEVERLQTVAQALTDLARGASNWPLSDRERDLASALGALRVALHPFDRASDRASLQACFALLQRTVDDLKNQCPPRPSPSAAFTMDAETEVSNRLNPLLEKLRRE